jgi:hypothetical protein
VKEFPHKRLLVFIVLFLFVLPAEAQIDVFLHPKKFYKKFFPNLKIKRVPVDSTYIKSYPNFLSVGTHVISPAIVLNVSPRESKYLDHASTFRTNISDILGFSGSYRYLNVGFAVLLKSRTKKDDDYASSFYRTATIKYNSPAYYLQFRYLKLKGLTDVNSNNNFDLSRRFLTRPDMAVKEFQFEGMYNFDWKRYSYLAPLTFSQRQVKSRMGFLLKAGVYYTDFSGTSPIINANQQSYYDSTFRNIKVIRSLTVRFAPGVGGNLIFLRRIYFSAMAFTSYDLYFYRYLKTTDERKSKQQNFVWTIDGKASVGYQSERLYGGLRFEGERRAAALQSVHTTMGFVYVGLEFGYRFNTPRAVRKVYKDTMPPGM